jgi:hypothetical protein
MDPFLRGGRALRFKQLPGVPVEHTVDVRVAFVGRREELRRLGRAFELRELPDIAIRSLEDAGALS